MTYWMMIVLKSTFIRHHFNIHWNLQCNLQWGIHGRRVENTRDSGEFSGGSVWSRKQTAESRRRSSGGDIVRVKLQRRAVKSSTKKKNTLHANLHAHWMTGRGGWKVLRGKGAIFLYTVSCWNQPTCQKERKEYTIKYTAAAACDWQIKNQSDANDKLKTDSWNEGKRIKKEKLPEMLQVNGLRSNFTGNDGCHII